MIHERLLQGMQIGLASQPFDGGDFGTVFNDGEGQAAIDALTINEHRTSTALPMIAALLCSREMHVLA